MLREHANSQTVMKEAISVLELKLAHKGLDQGGLAGTVRSNEGDTRIQVNVDVDTGKDGVTSNPTDVGFIKATERWGDLLGVGENEDAGRVTDDLSHDIDTLDCLDSRLHKGGTLRIESELVNELLDVTDLFHLSGTGCGIVLVFDRLNALELLEVTLVIGELLALEMNDFVDTGVEEVTGMRHDNNSCICQLLDVVLEPNQGW